MKKFSEILEEIKATRAAVTESENNEKRLVDLYTSEPTPRGRYEAKKGLEAEMCAAGEHTRNLKLSVALLKNNAKLALFAEVMPVALDVLKKYQGKPYGEKTRQKISDEIKGLTGCYFSISTRYSAEEYHICPASGDGYYSNDYAITVGPRYEKGQRKRFLVDNRIQFVTMEDLQIFYIKNRYFDDIPATIKEMRAAYERAVEAQNELEAACSAFNVFAVDGIPTISRRENIYPRILV